MACIADQILRRDRTIDTAPATPSLANWLVILTLGAIWGSAFMAMELALDGFGPLWVAALRTGLAAPALLVVAGATGQSLKGLWQGGIWQYVVPVGLFGMAMPFFLLSWGQQHVPSAFAGIAMGSLPIVLVPFAYFFLPDERLTFIKIAGLVIGFLGLVLLIGSGGTAVSGGPYFVVGGLACIGATFGYATASVITRRSPAISPLVFSLGALSVAAVTLVPLAALIEGPPRSVPSHALWAIVYAALFPTALAAYWRVLVIRRAGSVFMSLVAYLVPVFSVFFGVVFLGEELPAQTYLALAFILGGIGVSQANALRLAFATRAPR